MKEKDKTLELPMESCFDCIHADVCKYPDRIKKVIDQDFLDIDFKLATCNKYISIASMFGEDGEDVEDGGNFNTIAEGIDVLVSKIIREQGISPSDVQVLTNKETWECLKDELAGDPSPHKLPVKLVSAVEPLQIKCRSVEGIITLIIDEQVPFGQFYVVDSREE